MYLGDYSEDFADLCFTFSSRDADGAPTTLSGSPELSIYKSNGTTESQAGVTLSVDFDSRTGLNHVKIDLSADAFYATGADYSVVITTGTVDSVSVVGETVATFSIENRTALPKADYPTNFSSLGIESDGDLTKVNTLDGHTAQTGDTFAALPTNFADLTITDTTGLVSIAGDGLDAVTLPADLITATSIADDAIAAAGVADDVFNAVNAEVGTALADINLDHLVSAAVDTSFANTVHLDSVIGQLADVGSSATFDRTTDALEAIRDRGDAEWTTGGGGSAPTVEEIRAEIDSNSTQLAAIVEDTGTTLPNQIGGLNNFDPASDAVANVTLVATTTDLTNLPTIPTDWIAAAGVSAGAVTKIQNGLSTLAIGDISGLEITELSSVPGASPTLEEALALLYMALRNRVDVTSSTKEIHDDSGSVLATKNLSDSGTEYSEAKMS